MLDHSLCRVASLCFLFCSSTLSCVFSSSQRVGTISPFASAAIMLLCGKHVGGSWQVQADKPKSKMLKNESSSYRMIQLHLTLRDKGLRMMKGDSPLSSNTQGWKHKLTGCCAPSSPRGMKDWPVNSLPLLPVPPAPQAASYFSL